MDRPGSPLARLCSPPMPPRHSIEVSEEAGVRYLHFGTEWIQGAMRIARPWSLELEYTREMMAALLLRPEHDWPKNALIIGLGAGSVAKFLYRHRPAAQLTVVEINPEVVAVARQSFRLPDDPERMPIHIADGAVWMAEQRARYDCILVDGYDHNARAGALATEQFYRDCRKRLTSRGLLVINLFGRSRNFRHQLERLRMAFSGRALAFPSSERGNAIAFAAAGDAIGADMESLRAEAATLQTLTGLKLGPTLVRLQQAGDYAGGGLSL